MRGEGQEETDSLGADMCCRWMFYFCRLLITPTLLLVGGEIKDISEKPSRWILIDGRKGHQVSPGDSDNQSLRTAGGLPGVVMLNLHSGAVR